MFASSRDYRDSIDVVDNGLLKKAYVLYLIQTPGVLVIHKTFDLNQQADVVIQNIGDILIIFHTDLLPHNGEEEAIRVISRKPPAAIVFMYS